MNFICHILLYFFCRHVVNVEQIFSHAPCAGAPLTPESSFTNHAWLGNSDYIF